MLRALLSPALFSAAIASPSARPAQSSDAVIDRAVAAYAKVKTTRATFEQRLTNPLTGTTMVSRGVLQQRQPGRLSVRFTEPAGDMVVSDGRAVWVYLPSSAPGQVIKLLPGGGDAGFVDPVAQFLSAPRTKYTIADAGADTVDGRATRALTLVPKSENAAFTKGTVWIDTAGVLRQFEVTQPNGLVRRVLLTKIRLNVPVDRGAFLFTPPPGTRVLDQAALSGR